MHGPKMWSGPVDSPGVPEISARADQVSVIVLGDEVGGAVG